MVYDTQALLHQKAMGHANEKKKRRKCRDGFADLWLRFQRVLTSRQPVVCTRRCRVSELQPQIVDTETVFASCLLAEILVSK